MLELIQSVNSAVNNFIWGVPAMICIIGVGLLLTIKTKFLQIRKFPYAMKETLGRVFKKQDASDGSMTPFQAVCTALASTVGTGNIAGVAGAIAIGGPGAVFWMWVTALIGSSTAFIEATLSQIYKEKDPLYGGYRGGPAYYIHRYFEEKSKDSVGIDELLNAPLSPGRVLNLKRIALNEYLDNLAALNYITVNRTAGLDMVYLKKNIPLNEIVEKYYEKN